MAALISVLSKPLQAHVFCLVYGVDDEKSLESTRSYWLPKIREINDGDNLSRPVILVGNKDDLIMDLEESPLESVSIGYKVLLFRRSFLVLIS